MLHGPLQVPSPTLRTTELTDILISDELKRECFEFTKMVKSVHFLSKLEKKDMNGVKSLKHYKRFNANDNWPFIH